MHGVSQAADEGERDDRASISGLMHLCPTACTANRDDDRAIFRLAGWSTGIVSSLNYVTSLKSGAMRRCIPDAAERR
jgi:hypothetical protein